MNTIKAIYAYREMIFSLVRKDLRGRYKGSVLGFLWTFINPLLQLLVYTIVFSLIMRMNIEKYYIFLFVAIVPWIFFSSSLTLGASSILANQDMVKKIYFPRECIPISVTTSSFVNMMFSFAVVFAVLLVSGFGVSIKALLFMPLILVIEYIMALGIAMIASAVTVYFRDLEHIFAIIVMAWQFLTPVMYPQSMVEESLRGHSALWKIWNLNPMTPIINAYRDILYYKRVPEIHNLLIAFILGSITCIIGFVLFGRLQRGFAEEI